VRPLNIQIVFRTPVGGLFRHVRDLARGLQAEGQNVGVICDSLTGGVNAEKSLAELAQHCTLGVTRIPVSRLPGTGDIKAARDVARLAKTNRADIIHGHGAKGGLYARLAGWRLGIPSLYVPHGGSLHYSWRKPSGVVYLATEKLLRPLSGGLHFVCNFERDQFAAKIGTGRTPVRVIYNGLWPEEYEPATPSRDATDIVYVGELRLLKGVDVLLKALAIVQTRRPVTATIVGDGEDRETFKSLSQSLGLSSQVTFAGILPARQAFARGRLFVMPSRAESFPYVILEAAAAQMPIIASAVGGIPELLPAESMVPPDDPQALAGKIVSALTQGNSPLRLARQFDCQRMSREILNYYRHLAGIPTAALTKD
jgi:glycosyltransferase involved in cell wall biosynthesis